MMKKFAFLVAVVAIAVCVLGVNHVQEMKKAEQVPPGFGTVTVVPNTSV